MSNLPQRNSLVTQTANFLLSEIERGAWREWLPGERALCATLQVSRNTLRAALEQLKRDGVVHSEHGAGNRVLRKPDPARKAPPVRDVGLISPETLERLRPTQALWIDELRALLSERNCRLRIFSGPQYYRANPGDALEKLVAQNPHACWVLALSNVGTQRWFEKNGVPCIVAGSLHKGVNLPFRDLDHRAMCRHAAGMMLGLGHRRIGLVMPRSKRAGDLESEEGFIEGVHGSPHPNADVIVANHNESVAAICNAVRRLMDSRPRPTALLVANAYHVLTVVTRLAQMGYRVPEDVSIVSRDEDPFLSFVVPQPARYLASPHALAKALLRPVLEYLDGGVVTHSSVRIMPDFMRGGTLQGPPPAAES